MMRCEHCDRGQITGDSGICSSCGGSGFICAYEDETPMAVETKRKLEEAMGLVEVKLCRDCTYFENGECNVSPLAPEVTAESDACEVWYPREKS